jgi:hypothetical protein
MFLLITYILLHWPAWLVELSIDPSVFRKNADSWNQIGIFKLKDGKHDRLVLLYLFDSDTNGGWFYPNSFAIHAIYQSGADKWVHRTILEGARVRFNRMRKITPENLVMECRYNYWVRVKPGDDIRAAIKSAEEINKPFDKTISFVDGVLTAK